MSGAGAIWEAHAFCFRFVNELADCDVLETNDDGIDNPEARAVLIRAQNAARELREFLESKYDFTGNGQAELLEGPCD
jgi:hypothetical protein